MYTVKQAAAKLGISTKLTYALCAAGKIRHERYGLGRGTIRIPPEALEDYRQSCTVAAPRPAVCSPERTFKHLDLS
jgi:excisionase family DNA binding protein